MILVTIFGPGSAGYHSTIHGGLLLLRACYLHDTIHSTRQDTMTMGGHIFSIKNMQKYRYLGVFISDEAGTFLMNWKRRLFLEKKKRPAKWRGSRCKAKHILTVCRYTYLFQHVSICMYMII